jgi:hypothetical protein
LALATEASDGVAESHREELRARRSPPGFPFRLTCRCDKKSDYLRPVFFLAVFFAVFLTVFLTGLRFATFFATFFFATGFLAAGRLAAGLRLGRLTAGLAGAGAGSDVGIEAGIGEGGMTGAAGGGVGAGGGHCGPPAGGKGAGLSVMGFSSSFGVDSEPGAGAAAKPPAGTWRRNWSRGILRPFRQRGQCSTWCLALEASAVANAAATISDVIWNDQPQYWHRHVNADMFPPVVQHYTHFSWFCKLMCNLTVW